LLARSLPRELAPWTTAGLAFLGFLSFDINLLEEPHGCFRWSSGLAWGQNRNSREFFLCLIFNPAQTPVPKGSDQNGTFRCFHPLQRFCHQLGPHQVDLACDNIRYGCLCHARSPNPTRAPTVLASVAALAQLRMLVPRTAAQSNQGINGASINTVHLSLDKA
jgi:hypothetical protein